MSNKKLKTAIISLSAFLMLFIAACQPTPESGVVINKGDGLGDKVLNTAQNTGESVAHEGDRIVWNETMTVNIDIENLGNYTVVVNMDARVPEIPKKAPAFLIEPKEFGIEFMKKAAGYLMQGEIFDATESKQDVMMEILDYKKDISAHTIRDGYQENVDEWQEFLDKRYNDAPDSNGKAEYEYSDNVYGERQLSLKSYLNENNIEHFSAHESEGAKLIDNFAFRISQFSRSFTGLNYISGENMQANGVKASYKQALTTADKAMTELFEEPFAMVHSQITDIINDNEYLWNDGKETSIGQAYVFYYTREYGGIPSLFIDYAPTWGSEMTQEQFNRFYCREGACVVVDDRGIAQMWYDSYSGTVKELNGNVALMPFDEILERFKDGVFYHSIWGAPGSTAEINIKRIDFGMVREPVKDNSGQFIMVPAWNFIGDISNTAWTDIYGNSQEKSILALSAIDGSIITYYQPMYTPK